MHELFASSPLLFVAVVFLFSLLIGSFLNVVIYRLPIMMEREWRAQCAEFVGSPTSDASQSTTAEMCARSFGPPGAMAGVTARVGGSPAVTQRTRTTSDSRLIQFNDECYSL